MPVTDICRKAGISQATWKKRYDGLLPTEMRRLKQLEDENNKLRKVRLICAWIKRCCRTRCAESFEACPRVCFASTSRNVEPVSARAN
jgi:hypothetical protein